MPRPKPIGPEDRDRVAQLHAQGLSRNAIARATGRSGRTVSRIADDLGLSFERGEQVKAATEARKVDAAARRAQLALALLEDAERLREQLWAPALVYNFGGRDNVYEERTLDKPPFADQLKIVQAAGIAVTKAMDIEKYDRDESGGAAVDMWLDAMTGGPA